jgi:uncharacterized integral membrane protein
MMRRLYFLLLLAFLALSCAAFVHLNSAPVFVDFFLATVRVGLGQALIAALVLGWVIAALATLLFAAQAARARRRLKHELRLAKAEIRTLRATAPSHAP